MSASDRDSVDRLTDTIYETVGEPVKSASLFYALYYLVEVEGITEAAFDFKQLRDRLATGFYWYGIVSVSSEMSHIDTQYYIEGWGIAGLRNNPASPGEGPLIDHMDDLFRYRGQRFVDDVFAVINRLPQTVSTRNRSGVNLTLRALERDFGALSKPDDYLRLMRDMFRGLENTGEQSGEFIFDEGLTGWRAQYDGPAWRGLCDHLLRRGDISDTAWVDQCWSIEHNNSRWIDKVSFEAAYANLEQTVEPEVEAVADMLEMTNVRGEPVRSLAGGDVLRAVTDILDTARDGPPGRLFDWAEYFNSDVDVNLRRWRQRLNIR